MTSNHTPDKDNSSTEDSLSTVIIDLWREVLQTPESPCLDDNFFAMGGDSMAMVTLEFRIHEELGVSIPPGTVLTAPTLFELTSLVRSYSAQLESA